jgi:hypothetical protein
VVAGTSPEGKVWTHHVEVPNGAGSESPIHHSVKTIATELPPRYGVVEAGES